MSITFELNLVMCDSGADSRCGYGLSVTKREDACLVAEATWTDCEWPYENEQPQSITDTSGNQWHLQEFTFAPPCIAVLKLCRPINECATETADVYCPSANPQSYSCASTIAFDQVASQIDFSHCLKEQSFQIEGDVEKCKSVYSVCTDYSGLAPGHYIVSGDLVLIVREIMQECGAKCLAEVLAEPDYLGRFNESVTG